MVYSAGDLRDMEMGWLGALYVAFGSGSARIWWLRANSQGSYYLYQTFGKVDAKGARENYLAYEVYCVAFGSVESSGSGSAGYTGVRSPKAKSYSDVEVILHSGSAGSGIYNSPSAKVHVAFGIS